jgi:hypothetical protein
MGGPDFSRIFNGFPAISAASGGDGCGQSHSIPSIFSAGSAASGFFRFSYSILFIFYHSAPTMRVKE